jgi:hypothetical protein
MQALLCLYLRFWAFYFNLILVIKLNDKNK